MQEKHRAQSTGLRGRSTEHRAQGAEEEAQGTGLRGRSSEHRAQSAGQKNGTRYAA